MKRALLIHFSKFSKEIEEEIDNRASNYRPTLTDAGLCYSYNTMAEDDVFNEDSVQEFIDVYEIKSKELVKASVQEFTLMLDLQSRNRYPFVPSESTNFFRYLQVASFRFFLDPERLCVRDL